MEATACASYGCSARWRPRPAQFIGSPLLHLPLDLSSRDMTDALMALLVPLLMVMAGRSHRPRWQASGASDQASWLTWSTALIASLRVESSSSVGVGSGLYRRIGAGIARAKVTLSFSAATGGRIRCLRHLGFCELLRGPLSGSGAAAAVEIRQRTSALEKTKR